MIEEIKYLEITIGNTYKIKVTEKEAKELYSELTTYFYKPTTYFINDYKTGPYYGYGLNANL